MATKRKKATSGRVKATTTKAGVTKDRARAYCGGGKLKTK